MDITHCTKCGKKFNNTRIKIELKVSSDRLTSVGSWENVANMDIKSAEVLCSECFDVFVDTIDKAMNNNKE